MQNSAQARARVCFGSFEVDLNSGELRKHGHKRRLQRHSFVGLRTLLMRAGEVVRREELVSQLWPANVFVNQTEGLNTAVRKLRQALDDPAKSPRVVETLPRVGYRFIGQPVWVPTPASPAVDGPGFRISISNGDAGAITVTCEGRMADAAAGVLRSDLRPQLGSATRVVLDVGAVSQIDSVGLGAIVALFVAAATSGKQLELANVGGRVEQVLKTTGLMKVFNTGMLPSAG